jgi:hypothetical protein
MVEATPRRCMFCAAGDADEQLHGRGTCLICDDCLLLAALARAIADGSLEPRVPDAHRWTDWFGSAVAA